VSKKGERKKKDWNASLTDEKRYALSPEEVVRRKQLFVSKHNVLHSDVPVASVKSIMQETRARVRAAAAVAQATKSSPYSAVDKARDRRREEPKEPQPVKMNSKLIYDLETSSEADAEAGAIPSTQDLRKKTPSPGQKGFGRVQETPLDTTDGKMESSP